MTGNIKDNKARQPGLPVHKTNNERFNELLNGTRHARRIYNALMSMEPSVEQANQVGDKFEVLVGNLLSGLDVS